MKVHLEHEVGRLQELEQRCAELKQLASIISSDDRWMSTPLEEHESLVQRALACKAQIGTPLTLGTLLAAVLAQLESTQDAIHVMERQLCTHILLPEQEAVQRPAQQRHSPY